MCNHAVGTDDRTIADMYTGQNGSADANPHLVLYDNGTTVRGVAIVGIRIVVDGDKIHFRADEYAIADRYTSTVKEGAALLNPTSLPMWMFLP